MQMTHNDEVFLFLENWQATLQEAATTGCQNSDSQQVTLLLATLPNSWDSFITSQGCVPDFTFTKLLSNIVQQYAMMDKKDLNKSSAFYVKGKFYKNKNKNTNQPFKKRPFQKTIKTIKMDLLHKS